MNHCQRLAVTGVSHIMLRNCTECIACSYARFHLNVHGHSQTIYVSASRQKARLPANTIIFTRLQNLEEMFTERNELYCINALYLFGESEKSKSSPMIKLSSYMKSSGFGTGRALWLPHDVERRQVQWPWTSPQFKHSSQLCCGYYEYRWVGAGLGGPTNTLSVQECRNVPNMLHNNSLESCVFSNLKTENGIV